LIEAIGGNVPLFQQIREDLIHEELAKNWEQVGLLSVEKPAGVTTRYDIFFSYSHKDN
jgi:hypothetical protein